MLYFTRRHPKSFSISRIFTLFSSFSADFPLHSAMLFFPLNSGKCQRKNFLSVWHGNCYYKYFEAAVFGALPKTDTPLNNMFSEGRKILSKRKGNKMKTSKNYIMGLVLAVSFLVATNVKADVLNWYSDKDTYMSSVAPSDWTFGTFTQDGNGQSPRVWNFTMLNAESSESGKLTMSVFNGAGGLMEAPQGGSSTITFWHNSANNFDISFGNANFVDSFYMSVKPHSDWSAAINFLVTAAYWYNGTMYTTDAITIDTSNPFFGITLEEGAYLAAINFKSTGTPNNGYKIEAGLGGAATPEPATLAVLGLGLAGLGIARRRMKK